MHVGILGTGDVGKALSKGSVTLGHDVKMGSREAKNEKVLAWANSDEAKKKVASILSDFGWGVVDIGGIEGARYLEAMCMVWVLAAMRTNNWNQAFKLLRK